MLTYIAGSGAMGCRFGYQLHKAGFSVVLLDTWQEHVDAIKSKGLQVIGDTNDSVHIPIMKPDDATEKADVIILFTKSMQLSEMLESIKHIIGADTKVLCLLNGLGHQDVIEHYVDGKNIIMGVTVWTANLAGPGIVKLADSGAATVQSLGSDEASTAPLIEMLNAAHLNVSYSNDVTVSIWQKACINGSLNSTCALTDTTVGQFLDSEYGLCVVRAIIHEFVEVGRAEGLDLDEKEIYDYLLAVSKKVAQHYPSMHQDLVQNHRRTEIDYLNGYIARKGDEHGIPTPYCHMITELIHAKEHVLGII